MTIAKHYYEAHVTLDPVFGFQRDRADRIATECKFKLAKLFMVKGIAHDGDTFLTAHGKELWEIKARTEDVVHALRGAGFVVRRYKIEDTVLDSRIADELELLQ